MKLRESVSENGVERMGNQRNQKKARSKEPG